MRIAISVFHVQNRDFHDNSTSSSNLSFLWFRTLEKLLTVKDQQGWRLRKWLVAVLVLAVYLPVVPVLYGYVGTVGLAVGLVPCIFWGIWLGPYPGAFAAFMLAVPHYLILLDLGESMPLQGRIELIATHVVMATVTYFLTNGFHLRSKLAMQLAESEMARARFRGLFDRTVDMVFIVGLDLQILDVNDEALLLLGYKREELVGASYRKVIVPEEQEDVTQRVGVIRGNQARLPVYERTFLSKDGLRITAEMDSAVIRSPQGRALHYQAIGRDIRNRKAMEVDFYHKATHDELTGLYNRTLFAEVLWRAIERAKRNNRKMAVLFLDLDGFKKVNDTYGHRTGDLLLKAVAKRLHEVLRTTDTLARLGGDEFSVILEEVGTRRDAQKIAMDIETALGQTFTVANQNAVIGASCGVSLFPDDETDPDKLLSLADMRMYKLKGDKYASRATKA